MHDGSIPTLNAVVQFYNAGGGGDPRQDPRIRPLNLTAAESESLVAFLTSLTGDNEDALAADARSVAVGERMAEVERREVTEEDTQGQNTTVR